MKIGLQTWGSEGDVRPLLALGYGLVRAGHEVTLGIVNVDGRDFRELAQPLGVRTIPIAAGYFSAQRDALHAVAGQIITMRNPIRQLKLILKHLYEPIKEAQHDFSRELCATHDLVLGHFLVDTLAVAAECARKPYASLMTVGSVPSPAQPPIGAPNLGAWGNLLLWHLAAWVINHQFGPALNALRQREGLPLVRDVLREAFGSHQLNLISNSPTLYPPQPGWPAWHKVCGYLAPPSAPETLEPLVDEFIAAGSAPVYMTFGSMLTIDQPLPFIAESVTAFLEAARLAGVRAIVQAPWSRLDGTAPAAAHIVADTPDVLRLSRAPHEHIFPRCALVVHHGGAGSTHAALAAGRPAVIVPHATDQTHWGQTLARLGVAAPPLQRRQLTGHRLAQRIRVLHANPDAARRAQELGARLRVEDGITTATRWVEAFACEQGILPASYRHSRQ